MSASVRPLSPSNSGDAVPSKADEAQLAIQQRDEARAKNIALEDQVDRLNDIKFTLTQQNDKARAKVFFLKTKVEELRVLNNTAIEREEGRVSEAASLKDSLGEIQSSIPACTQCMHDQLDEIVSKNVPLEFQIKDVKTLYNKLIQKEADTRSELILVRNQVGNLTTVMASKFNRHRLQDAIIKKYREEADVQDKSIARYKVMMDDQGALITALKYELALRDVDDVYTDDEDQVPEVSSSDSETDEEEVTAFTFRMGVGA